VDCARNRSSWNAIEDSGVATGWRSPASPSQAFQVLGVRVKDRRPSSANCHSSAACAALVIRTRRRLGAQRFDAAARALQRVAALPSRTVFGDDTPSSASFPRIHRATRNRVISSSSALLVRRHRRIAPQHNRRGMLRYLFINYSRTHSDQSDLRLIAATFEAIGWTAAVRAVDPEHVALGEIGISARAPWAITQNIPTCSRKCSTTEGLSQPTAGAKNVFAVLAQFPQLPPKWLAMMWSWRWGARRRSERWRRRVWKGEGEGAADRRRVVRRQGRHARDRGGVARAHRRNLPRTGDLVAQGGAEERRSRRSPPAR